MDLTPEVQQLGADLAATAAKNGARVIAESVRSLRAAKKTDETISGLEEIIQELIDDKARAIGIAQAYQQELVAQRLNPGDILYISETILPLVKQFAEASGNDASKSDQFMKAVESFLSVETVNVMQLLGFNFRRGIGEPLTDLVRQAIVSRAPGAKSAPELALQSAQLENQAALAKLSLDAAAYARFQALYARS